MGTIANKTTYLNTTKQRLKDSINRLGGDLTAQNTFRSYAEELDDIYDSLPKVTREGSSLSLTPTRKGGLSITPLGACEQDTTAYIDVGTIEQGAIAGTDGSNVSSSSYVRCNDYIEVKPNNKYTLTRNVSTGGTRFRFYDSSKTYLGQGTTSGILSNDSVTTLASGVTSGNITIVNTSVAYFRFDDNSNDLTTQYTISTQAPTPDYPQPIKVVTGDNSIVVSNNEFDYTQVEILNCYIDSDGNWQTSDNAYSFRFPVEPNKTYRISANNPDETIFRTGLSHSNDIPTNNNPISLYNVQRFTNTNSRVNYTTSSVDKYIVIQCSAAHGSDTIQTIQIVTQSQTYTLHLGTNYLAGIEGYRDEIVGSIDNWKIRRNVGKVVLNGSEEYTTRTNNIGVLQMITRLSTSVINNIVESGSIGQLCNYARYSHTTYNQGNIGKFIIQTNRQTFICVNSNETIETFKTKLQDNNLIIYVPISVATEIPIIDTTLITDLNNIYQAMGYDGTTNITITSNPNNAQMIAEVSALKELS